MSSSVLHILQLPQMGYVILSLADLKNVCTPRHKIKHYTPGDKVTLPFELCKSFCGIGASLASLFYYVGNDAIDEVPLLEQKLPFGDPPQAPSKLCIHGSITKPQGSESLRDITYPMGGPWLDDTLLQCVKISKPSLQS